MEEGGGPRNKRRLRMSNSEESDEMVFARRRIGRSSNGALSLKMNRSSSSKDKGEIEACELVGEESSGGMSFLRSGIERKSIYQKNKVKFEAPDVGEDNYGNVGGLRTRLRFRSGSSRSNGSIEVQKKKMKNGHLKCNADGGEVNIDRELSRRGAGAASIAQARDAELIRNSIGKRKFSKLLEGHNMLPGVTMRSVYLERKGSKFEFGDGFCDTGIKVQGKSGVLKLIPNKRMKLAVYEQTCEQMEAEGSRKLLTDSHRNALVGMGKKLNGSLASSRKILKNHCDTLTNGMNMMQGLRTDVDDCSSSGTESRSISDGLTAAMGRNKRSSQAASSITRGEKEPVNMYHPENTKVKAFRGMGMKERMSTPISALHNHSNQILLNRKAKVCTVKTEDCISSSQESGSIDLSRIKLEVKSSNEEVSVMKNSRQSKSSRQTEKQMLRDQIKNMLIEAGWTIDMRPRRGRTYRDHVYVSPAGTEYWSITKAYYALEKQFNVQGDQIDGPDDKENKSFSSIPADVLSMLTRKTVKKKMREQLAKQKQKQEKGSRNAKSIKSKSKPIKKGNIISSATQRGKAMKEKPKGKGKFRKVSEESDDSWQGNSTSINSDRAMKPVSVPKSFADSNVGTLGKKNNKQKRYALLARSVNKEDNGDSNVSLRYPGKLTVLSWLIDSGTVPENAKVQYMNRRRTKVMLDGWITKEGIHCSCCSKILSVSKFEIHAGSKLRQPFQNIYVETGVSLLQCQLEAWNLQKECDREEFHLIQTDGDDPNDDTCGNCGDGGNLICCDGCPSTFHQGCLNVKMLPSGDWHCPNCSCKFCGVADVGDSPLFSCSLCERKYHQNCTGETNFKPHYSFCGKSCRKLFEQLQKLLGTKNDLEGGYSWTLIQRIDCESESFPRGLSQRAEWNSKISVALAVMDECFLPIVDRRSGINLIHNVLYNCGSNFSRLNYSGFYTAILERGDEIISAASIRIHGTSLAEMPFIGTRHMYRHQGMCRRLLNAIELVLFSLNVERLIIPSIYELMHTWTVVFGFKPLEESHRQEMKSMSLLVFPGTDMLQKSLLKCNLAGANSTDDAGKISELSGNNHDRHVDANELLVSNFVKPDAHAFKEGLLEHEAEAAKDGCSVDGSCQNAAVGSTITCEPLCNILEPLLVEVDAATAQPGTTALDTVAQSFGAASENNG